MFVATRRWMAPDGERFPFMTRLSVWLVLALVGLFGPPVSLRAAESSPLDALPEHLRQLTDFGERADWSHDGKRLLFLSKTFGDAMELELATGAIRNLTAHYSHHGYTRALYLVNGDILLAGPVAYDLNDVRHARRNCILFVLDPDDRQPAVSLGVKANEGPAVSRTRLHVAWTDWHDPEPDDERFYTRIYAADIGSNAAGRPVLAGQELILDSRELDFGGALETQNFRPPLERELILCLYTDGGRQSDVVGLELTTKTITRYTRTPDFYEEPEGIFPDGSATLVEADLQNGAGPRHVDWWRFALDGSGEKTRLTFFSEFEHYKCSNPVVSDDGRFIAGQLAKAGDDYGVGHGLLLFDLSAAALAEE
jgi:hypothetical protein